MDKFTFGNNLYNLRTERKLTQKQLAKYLGVSDKSVSKWENGEAMPRIKTLQSIAECFGITYSALLSDNPSSENLPSHELFYKKRRQIQINNYILSQPYCFIVTIFMVLFKLMSLLVINVYDNSHIIYSVFSFVVTFVVVFYQQKIIKETIKNIDNISESSYKFIALLEIPLIVISIIDTLFLIDDFVSKFFMLITYAASLIYILTSICVIFSKRKNFKQKGSICAVGSAIVMIFLLFPLWSLVTSYKEGSFAGLIYLSSLIYILPISDIGSLWYLFEMNSIFSDDYDEAKEKIQITFFVSGIVILLFAAAYTLLIFVNKFKF